MVKEDTERKSRGERKRGIGKVKKKGGAGSMRREGSFAEEIVSTQFDQGK